MNWVNRNIQNETPPKSVIIKVPTIDSLNRLYEAGGEAGAGASACFENVVRLMHNDECAVYKFLDGQNVIPMPRCYAAIPSVQDGDRGVLILEDMSDKGVGMKSFADYLNLAQTYEMVEALASLHAWSVTTTCQWKERVAKLSEREAIYKTFTQMTPFLAVKVRDQMADQFGHVPAEKVGELMSKYVSTFDDEMTPRPNLPLVLVYGDVHCMNVMFEKRMDGGPGDKLVAIFDFQLAHRGYGTEDLARLMTMGTSSMIKRKHGDEILRRYVEAFNSKVNDESKHIEFDHVKDAFNEMFSLMGVWIGMTAAIAEDFLKKPLDRIQDEHEKRNLLDGFITNCALMYKDAAEILGW